MARSHALEERRMLGCQMRDRASSRRMGLDSRGNVGLILRLLQNIRRVAAVDAGGKSTAGRL